MNDKIAIKKEEEDGEYTIEYVLLKSLARNGSQDEEELDLDLKGFKQAIWNLQKAGFVATAVSLYHSEDEKELKSYQITEKGMEKFKEFFLAPEK